MDEEMLKDFYDELTKPHKIRSLSAYSLREICKFIVRQTKKDEQVGKVISQMIFAEGDGAEKNPQTYQKIWNEILLATKLTPEKKLIGFSILEKKKKINLKAATEDVEI